MMAQADHACEGQWTEICHGQVEWWVLPSGNLTQLWKITMFNGTTHYFYGHFQQLY